MKLGFHAGTVNDVRSAGKCQIVGCRLRGSLQRPSGKIVEDVHSHGGKQSKWAKESDVDLLFSCVCCQTKWSIACSSGYQSLQKYEAPVTEQAKGHTHRAAGTELDLRIGNKLCGSMTSKKRENAK